MPAPGQTPSATQPEQEAKLPRTNIPPRNVWDVSAVTQEADGPWRRLRGHARLESTEMLFQADEIDWNSDTGDVEAHGNVFFQQFERNYKMWADRLEYNTEEEKGKFYNVHGTGQPRIVARPGILTSTSPYYFQGEWAERIGEKYILHNGFVTNCKVPRPWWTLRGPIFDIIPGERAIARRAVFRIKGFPLFYAPFFYKSLEKLPRHSGFLTPNIGNSSLLGKMVGLGYFWAINRSYDATYRFQDFTARGYAHHLDLRGKPREGSDFDAILYGVQDRGLVPEGGGEPFKAGGLSLSVAGKAELGHGFYARGLVNYLSSLRFRQTFTESFNEAIASESNSTVSVSKQWSTYSLDMAFERRENFQSATPGDSIVIRKLPEFDFSSRDRQPWERFPVWISFDSAAGLLRRSQPLFQTRQFTDRLDFQPRIMTEVHWKDFHLIPSFSIRETHYGESQEKGQIIGKNLTRSTREFSVDLIAPTLARVYQRKTFLGDKLKHVIEPRASFHYVAGVEDFNRIIRFDETDLLSNTKEAEISVTNRLYAKRGDQVTEVLSWELWQARYFDPTFGGAVVAGRRNVVLSTVELTPFAFLDRPRVASPVVSLLRLSPKAGFGFEWESDYDPTRHGITNSTFGADVRVGQFFLSAGHNQVHSDPVLSPNANQFRGSVGFGNDNRRGWNAGFNVVYDYRLGVMQFATTQVTYNTDCCGLSVQFRRFSFGTRNENQFRLAFAVANIGSFGTLKKQERLF